MMATQHVDNQPSSKEHRARRAELNATEGHEVLGEGLAQAEEHRGALHTAVLAVWRETATPCSPSSAAAHVLSCHAHVYQHRVMQVRHEHSDISAAVMSMGMTIRSRCFCHGALDLSGSNGVDRSRTINAY
jgi:hypothetical protein